MNTTAIRMLRDAEDVSRTAAAEFTRLAGEAIAANGRFSVALSGGSTPRRLYELLAGRSFRDLTDWSKVELFWGDERSVPPDHKDSNYRMAREALLDKVPVPTTHVHRIQAERADRDAAADAYQAEIARVFGVPAKGEPPAIDLVLLGMGPDAHTASLFPGTTALRETVRWIVPNYVDKLATYRLTLTTVILNQAACVMFLIAGADKAGPLVEVLEGPAELDRLPSQRIRPATGHLIWLVDAAATAKLRRSLA